MLFRCDEFWLKLTVNADPQRCLCIGCLFVSPPAATFLNNSTYLLQFGAFVTEKTTYWLECPPLPLFHCLFTPDCVNANSPKPNRLGQLFENHALALATPSWGDFLAIHCQITHAEEQADLPKWSKYESCYYMNNAACKALSSFRASVILFWGNHVI